MAEICCGVVSEADEATSPCKPSSRAARRRRMEIRRFKLAAEVAATTNKFDSESFKRQKLVVDKTSPARICDNAAENLSTAAAETDFGLRKSIGVEVVNDDDEPPKYGFASVCGRRRDMEDAVAIHPSFLQSMTNLHFYGVYDGHGCSHVAVRCRDRLHELVEEELMSTAVEKMEWKAAMERSFSRMDKEVIAWNEHVVQRVNCRCELQSPECDAVGSTAVVAIVTPDKIVVANCGDSRAVLSRKGKAVPLSSDHKPDRPDELNRIQEAGGRVIYWDGPRVLGVLAMSRAIGDNYLKPYVSCEPEVTIIDRTPDDDCLILASDGLWDVVSNDTACGVARMCLRGKVRAPPPDGIADASSSSSCCGGVEKLDKACSDASMLLTKLALARHSADNVSVVVVDLRM